MNKVLKIVSVYFSGVICIFLFFFGQMPLIEGYNPVVPDVDTYFSEKYDETFFRNIAIGDNIDDVIENIGKPLDIVKRKDGQSVYLFSMDGKCKWKDFAWLNRRLYVDVNGTITAINISVVYD
jgi:hypothetical protein